MDISVKEGMMKRIRLNVTRVLLAGSILACGANIYRDALFLDQEDFDAVAGCLDINLGFDAREIGDLSEIDFDGQHYYLRVDYRDNKYVLGCSQFVVGFCVPFFWLVLCGFLVLLLWGQVSDC